MPVPTTPSKNPVGEDMLPPSPPASPGVNSFPPGDPNVMAGYTDCLREALRFLLHEEKLPPSHPAVAGLAWHLISDQSLDPIAQGNTLPAAAGYELTLEEDTSDDEDMMMEEEMEDIEDDVDSSVDELLEDQGLRNSLVRLLFQGCDLIAAPVQPQANPNSQISSCTVTTPPQSPGSSSCNEGLLNTSQIQNTSSTSAVWQNNIAFVNTVTTSNPS